MAARMVIQQPPVLVNAVQSNQWSSGICDCCNDIGECCCAFWCFPCYACKVSKDHGECLCLPLLDFLGFIPPVSLAMRVSVRQRYGITGSICNDCLYSVFCTACSWCQISREMKARQQLVVFTGATHK
ncbi:cornifelin homolog B-like [Scleropages formosus]|uniref:Cornifelin homolog B-like n=1 Tax=Scleropages formosus TaxID=113540 RepID=A0A8C9RY84_SCLFO|nr:cornifelin homolog B-like [Scleropages formosus]